MPRALEVILAAKSNLSGGGFENLSPGTGDTFTFRTASPGSRIEVEEIWALDDASKAQISLKSPNFHDQVRGLLLAIPSGVETGRNPEDPSILFPGPLQLPARAADTFSAQVSGTAADNVVAAMLVAYDDLPGADAQLRTWDEIRARMRQPVGILVQPTNGNCDYGTPVAINSVDQRLNSAAEYAILGALTDTPCSVIGITARATSNYRIGMPGLTDPEMGGDYFVRLSQKYQRGHIPVFRGFDAPNVLIDTVDAGTGATPNITMILAELS